MYLYSYLRIAVWINVFIFIFSHFWFPQLYFYSYSSKKIYSNKFVFLFAKKVNPNIFVYAKTFRPTYICICIWAWKSYMTHTVQWSMSSFQCSVQLIIIFLANRNRNRFASPTSLQKGIGIVCEFQNLQIGIGIILGRQKVFTNYSGIPKLFVLSLSFFIISCSWLKYIVHLIKLTKQNHSVKLYFLHIYSNIKMKYSWILGKILVNMNNIWENRTFENRNHIHQMKNNGK